ncbi:MAG TPA: helix-turn-helix domain-containing protein [Actinomycetota bacterium]|jgi:DNA-binding MarR family transcriptional regulator|nr:helix-turn-helix domain-containing protein [Actinomycetota bacterium]
MNKRREIGDEDYAQLLEFRTGLRVFLKWSKAQAAKVGLAPSQHQLLLAIRGHQSGGEDPTIGEVADYLLIKPHSAAELVDRAVAEGLVERRPDNDDRRVVRLRLTRLGTSKLAAITSATLEELTRLSPRLRGIWRGLEEE